MDTQLIFLAMTVIAVAMFVYFKKKNGSYWNRRHTESRAEKHVDFADIVSSYVENDCRRSMTKTEVAWV